MGFTDVWNKTLVYFGIAEEEDWDEEGYVTDEDIQRSYAERPNVRRLRPRRRERELDDWTDPEPTVPTAPTAARPRVAAVPGRRPCASTSSSRAASTTRSRSPTSSRSDSGDPQPAEHRRDLSKRLIDFASGLTYALDGGMQRVADKVFLLTPRNVEVSPRSARAARARRLLQSGVTRRPRLRPN
jgi:cell division inhibitor SepF